jgi:TonB family protein
MRRTILLALGVAACSHSSANEAQAGPPPAEEAPVAINAEVPVAYPPTLFDRGVDGEVKLRLFADSTGKLVPESTKILESSGYPAMDSAALAGAPRLKFAPGRRHGLPVATAFQQAIEFRHPSSAAVAPAGDAGETKPLPPPVTLSTQSTPAATPTPVPPKPRPRPRPRPDSTKADSARTDTTRRDTTQRDTTKAKPDTTRPKPDSGPKPVRPDSNDRTH